MEACVQQLFLRSRYAVASVCIQNKSTPMSVSSFFISGMKTAPLSAWQTVTVISQFGFAISSVIEAICQFQQSRSDAGIYNGTLLGE